MALTPYPVAIAALTRFFPNLFTPDSEYSTIAAWLSELPLAPPARQLKLPFFQNGVMVIAVSASWHLQWSKWQTVRAVVVFGPPEVSASKTDLITYYKSKKSENPLELNFKN